MSNVVALPIKSRNARGPKKGISAATKRALAAIDARINKVVPAVDEIGYDTLCFGEQMYGMVWEASVERFFGAVTDPATKRRMMAEALRQQAKEALELARIIERKTSKARRSAPAKKKSKAAKARADLDPICA